MPQTKLNLSRWFTKTGETANLEVSWSIQGGAKGTVEVTLEDQICADGFSAKMALRLILPPSTQKYMFEDLKAYCHFTVRVKPLTILAQEKSMFLSTYLRSLDLRKTTTAQSPTISNRFFTKVGSPSSSASIKMDSLFKSLCVYLCLVVCCQHFQIYV